jgi:bacteriocin-like protein
MKTNFLNAPGVQELNATELQQIEGGQSLIENLFNSGTNAFFKLFKAAADACSKLGPSAEQAAMQYN